MNQQATVTGAPQAGPCCAPTGDAMSPEDAEGLSRLFSALGDPVRLRLFSIIAAEGEACSCNLEAPLGRSQPTISHHTRILADAGLIVGEKRGRWTWWRVVPERLDAAQASLAGKSTVRTGAQAH